MTSPSANNTKVQRNLKERHMAMIAIGGTIGTGLFLGIGNALEKGGPLGLLLGYMVMGTVMYGMLVALGEMATKFPISGSLSHFPSRFFDRALGFSVGWNYWYSFVLCLPTEITAAAIVVSYWKNPLSEVAWITIFLFTSGAINFFGVRWYGEVPFPFDVAAVKVLAIITLIIMGLVLDLGGGPGHEVIGFKHWRHTGVFKQLKGIPGVWGRFLSFWSVFIQASYSFLGTEMVAIAAGEAANPRKSVPKAISSVFYRILLFYILGALVVGMLVASDDPRLLGGTGDATSSPFVIAINNAGIKILPDLVNSFILVASYSAASSQIYGASRVLYGLASDGMAPAIFKKCTKGGLPLPATFISALPGLLAYMSLNEKASTLFNWLVTPSATAGLMTWWTICLSYLRFYKGLKVQGYDRDSLPYKAPFQPYLTYYTLTVLTLVIMLNGFEVFIPGNWSTGEFVVAYITLPMFLIGYIVWKLIKKTELVRAECMDLVSGQKDFLDADEVEVLEKPEVTKPWGKLMDVVSLCSCLKTIRDFEKHG
ncbi:uncharacterized protein MELLADRAFT_34045 [Melampsora larici-populina 98AG31]|uniref:Amino acid permease/ SLC12A domain-containing protein n=1 Tax=Melampsora larici-populina (strain 98AG31 / pathotype 3-4-7) TaxID=747676 RepID=F4RBK8_MELLP|nr:uncharacterized protein MELLADRAFT_34045 [Melampsora larici-populina 98AG31]EGG10318.1 hypothetical protein MELLADRAFT_34045 [Melampsora larici-populina 98AG31]